MKAIQFKDFITLQRGFDLPRYSRDEGEYPVITATGMHGSHSEFKVYPPGVITGRSGSLGEVVFVERPYWPLNTTLWVKDFKGNEPRYVYYFLKTLDLKRFNSGAGVPTLNRNHLDTLLINVHDSLSQINIAAVLSAYDNLIENNLRRIKILEEMAQTLYREWFLHFRFPGHQKVKMVDSSLGKIPEGWEVSTVGDNITVVPRKDKIKTGDYLAEGVIPVIDQGKDFIAGYIDDTSLAYDGPLPIIVFGDHTCVLKWVDFRFAVGADGTQLIQPEYPEKIPPRFLFYTLQFAPLEQFGYQRHFKYLKEAKILIPSGNLVRKFEEVVSSNTDFILNLQRQNLNLRRIRDLLLPKLISGELDVSKFDIRTGANGNE